MKKIIISIAIFAASVFSAAAQNLDPTVEVSRGYQGKLVDVHKPAMEMSVPDTVQRFDLDFDYSVFDNPYKGSYEFNPYTMDMKPEGRKVTQSQFYLNAGAGYTIHPTLDVLWSPVAKGPFKVDVYGVHRSYIGDYRAPHVGKTVAGQAFENGYDLFSKAGVDMGYDWEKAGLESGVSYYGVAAKGAFSDGSSYNAVDAYAAVASKGAGKFQYGIDASYRYGHVGATDEHLFNLTANFAHLVKAYDRMEIGLGLDFGVYQDGLEASCANIWILPRYVREKGRLSTSVGVRVSAVTSASESFAKANQYVYPDIRVNYNVIKDAMKVYLNVTGGESLNTYASLIEKNHHFNLSYAMPGSAVLGSSVERVRPEVGAEGRISSFFSYGLRGGYVMGAHTLMNVLVEGTSGYRPAFGYGDSQQIYAGADCTLDLSDFRLDAAFRYTNTWGVPQIEGAWFVMPSEFMAEVSAEYNWYRRIYAGVDCEFASRAKTLDAALYLPYYVDMGVSAEYVFSRKFSVWLRGGNLLNMEIQRNPLFAENGVNLTAGICLTF